MLFNSLHFALFLPLIFILYWFLFNRTVRIQNSLLLVSSYFFYACWDYRFLFLLIFSTLLDYFTALRMKETEKPHLRKFWFWLSVCINLGFLAIFKYYNFFSSSFAQALALVGIKANFVTLSMILPVGISFYTFHGLSYVIDVYKKRIQPVSNFVDYSVFVSFFPLLVAGPIERATHLLPQIRAKRSFDYSTAMDGMRQILWGLFKKVVIADNCAEYANTIFAHSAHFSGSTNLLGAIMFATQIYCDFSGYSDIALGTARLLGIELLRNFAFPYFSRDMAEFWRRWHISLSSWFRDYVYIPLGGSKVPKWKSIRNIFIIFLLSGFWHGANWTFLFWGALNALYFLPLLLLNRNRNNLEIVAKGKRLPSIKELFQMFTTFALTVLAWIFFRADTLNDAFHFLSRIFSRSLFSLPQGNAFIASFHPYVVFLLIVILIIVEWFGREYKHALADMGLVKNKTIRYLTYYLLAMTIFFVGGKGQHFIYFQF